MTRRNWSAADGEALRSALVLASFEKPDARTLAAELQPWLEERLERVDLRTDIRAYCAERRANRGRANEVPDLVCVLGGDGALLGAVRAFADQPVPTLGINLGRVGFLASTPATRWRETLQGVLEGEGTLEYRQRLEVRMRGRDGPREVALNDVSLMRGSHQGMLIASLFVDEEWVTDYRADGVIVATPSGSTAYSLSAGGPILAPSVPAFVVTPICSQGLSNRPIVLSDQGELSLRVMSSAGVTTLAVDGQSYHSVHQGNEVHVTRHPEPYPLFAMPELDPYRRLRDRLGWRGSLEEGRFEGA